FILCGRARKNTAPSSIAPTNMKGKPLNPKSSSMKHIKFLLIVQLAFMQMQAQQLLTAEEAVRIALENNYEIRIASNDLKIDQQNISLANAGMLPRIDASVADN